MGINTKDWMMSKLQGRQFSSLLAGKIMWHGSIDSTKQTPNAMDDRKSNQSAENRLNGIIMTQRQQITHPFDMDTKRVPSLKMIRWTAAINKHTHKTPSLFLVFHFYEAWKMRNCSSKCHFFVLLNDREKDIKVLSMVRSRRFNEPKKINAHGLSNFRESGKNLRKNPVWFFFVVSPYGPKKS